VARPAIAAFAVFSFVVHWNDYLWPLLVARSAEIHTPALALAIFNNAEVGRDFGALTAGAAIVTIPAIIAFLLAQQNFVEGISGGEIPG
jgi:multiple sugar transport system permease protein